jgi:hypothetical protein
VADNVIANMRARIEQCRRLANATNDAPAFAVLRKMANDIEADVKRLEAEAARRNKD